MRSGLVVLGISALAAASAAAQPSDETPCYDTVVVGRIRDVIDFVDLNELLPRQPGELYWGGRFDLDVAVERVFVGEGVPDQIPVQAILTSQPKDSTPLLLFLRHGEDGVYRAAYTDIGAPRNWLGRYVIPDGLAEEVRRACDQAQSALNAPRAGVRAPDACRGPGQTTRSGQAAAPSTAGSRARR